MYIILASKPGTSSSNWEPVVGKLGNMGYIPCLGNAGSKNWEHVLPRSGRIGSNVWKRAVPRTANPRFQDWEALVRTFGK